MAGGEPVILDTCALLWLAEGAKKLSAATRKEIDAAPVLYVSAVSGFEIALKTAAGKLELPMPVELWFDRLVERHGLTVLPIELRVCICAAELPHIHNDPCDRFIIATAKQRNLPVVMADERFGQYGIEVLS